MTGTEFAAEGWRYAMETPPPSAAIVEFVQDISITGSFRPPWFGRWSELPPEFNVIGLWWREAA